MPQHFSKVEMSSVRQVRVAREKNALLKSAIASNILEMEGDVIKVRIEGPPETPFAGLGYTLRVEFPANFPFYPPKVTFEAPVPYHPNISMDKGLICLDVLKMAPVGNWKANIGTFLLFNLTGIEAVIEAVTRLLAEPNVDDPLSFEVAKEYLVDYAAFCNNVRKMNCKN